jgi:UDP-N-acetylmuramate-alanine ligase
LPGSDDEEGYKVSGSDLQSNNTTKKLSELGIEVFQAILHPMSGRYSTSGIFYRYSSDNPEIVAARRKDSDFLARPDAG